MQHHVTNVMLTAVLKLLKQSLITQLTVVCRRFLDEVTYNVWYGMV